MQKRAFAPKDEGKSAFLYFRKLRVECFKPLKLAVFTPSCVLFYRQLNFSQQVCYGILLQPASGRLYPAAIKKRLLSIMTKDVSLERAKGFGPSTFTLAR